MSQRNIIYTIRFTEKEWKRLEQKIRENDEWKFKYGTKEGRVNIAAYIRDMGNRESLLFWRIRYISYLKMEDFLKGTNNGERQLRFRKTSVKEWI